MRVAGLLLLLVCLTGCGQGAARAAVASAAIATPAVETVDAVATADARVAQLESLLAAARADRAAAAAAASADRLAARQRLLDWLWWALVLAVVGCSIAAALLPVGRTRLVAAAAACALVLAVVQGLGLLLPWLPWVGAGLLVAAAAAALLALRRHRHVTDAALDFGNRLKALVREQLPELWQGLKESTENQQGRLQAVIDALAKARGA